MTTSLLQRMPSAIDSTDYAVTPGGARNRWQSFSRYAILLLFCVFAAMIPLSIKGAQRSWKLAFAIWVVTLLIERRRPFPLPLTLPLLAYVVCSAISTALSPDPFLSWDRMKIVCLVMVGIVFAENVTKLATVRLLVILLLLSTWLAAAYTAWQYTYGVGLEIVQIPGSSPLARAGLAPGDIIAAIDGHDIHSPADIRRVVGQAVGNGTLKVQYLRSSPFSRLTALVHPDDILQSGLGTDRLKLATGKPARAQGTFYHYIVFAEILMQMACLAWGMLLSADPQTNGWRVFYATTFFISVGTLLATETRAALVALTLGCLVAMVKLVQRHSRMWISAALFFALLAGIASIYHSRHDELVTGSDIGMQFRYLMWEDGLRLVRQHPWFGVGMETSRDHWRDYGLRGFAQFNVVSGFHSTPMQMAVERGLTTLAAWIWFVVAYLLFLVHAIRRIGEHNRLAAGVLTAALAGFAGFLATSLVHYNLGEEQVATIQFFYFGLAVAVDRICAVPAVMAQPK